MTHVRINLIIDGGYGKGGVEFGHSLDLGKVDAEELWNRIDDIISQAMMEDKK
jgi:hypothetical protein